MDRKTRFFSILISLLFIDQQSLISQSSGEIGFLDSTFVWTEYHFYGNGSQSWKYTIDGTPIIFFNKTFYEVLRSHDEFSSEWEGFAFYIRYENGIVYVKQNQDEEELVNFNLMVNDTFIEFHSNVPLIVDQIDSTMLVTGQKRKRLLLRCYEDVPGTDYYTEWVEGIGDIDGLFHQNLFCQIDGTNTTIMCIYQDDTIIYHNPEFDSCWMMPVATEELKEETIILSPNPASEWITILGLEGQFHSIRIFDVFGRQIFKGDEDEIIVKDFMPGYYYVVVRLRGAKALTRRFVKF